MRVVTGVTGEVIEAARYPHLRPVAARVGWRLNFGLTRLCPWQPRYRPLPALMALSRQAAKSPTNPLATWQLGSCQVARPFRDWRPGSYRLTTGSRPSTGRGHR